MKIVDLFFYFCLCIVACVLFFVFNSNKELHFSIPTFDLTQTKKHDIYEKEQLLLDDIIIKSIDIEQIDDMRYLVSYLGINNENEQKIYGFLFYPNKYSTIQNGKWQNISTNSRNKSDTHILFTKDMFKKATKQNMYLFNTPFFKRDDSTIYFFFNTKMFSKTDYSKAYIFSTSLHDIVEYLEDIDSNKKDKLLNNGKSHIFKLYEKLELNTPANINAFLSYKPIIAYTNKNDKNFILPFYIKMIDDISFFGIFDSKFKLQDTIKTNNISYISNPLITPIQEDYRLYDADNNILDSHSCIAIYNNLQKNKESKLYYQMCRIGNGTLNLDELNISDNIIGNNFNVTTFRSYLLLVYTDKDNVTLNLAIWNGNDFIKLKEIDRNKNGKIISPNIVSNGDYAYIAYAKETQSKINIITINETYIKNLISSNEINKYMQ